MKRIIWIIITILWICFIFFNSTRHAAVSSNTSGIIVDSLNFLLMKVNISIKLEVLSIIVRKTAHFFEYFILAVFSYNIIKTFRIWENKKILYGNASIFSFLIVIVFCTLIASIDEFVQGFIPGRARQFSDVVIDLLGSIFAVILVVIFNFKKVKSTLNNK